MNAYLLVSCLLWVFVGVIHSVLGERFILRDLLAMPWPGARAELFKKRTLRFAWHITSLAWWGLAGVTVAQASTPTLQLIAGIAWASALLTIVASRWAHLAWPIFATIGTLTLVGAHGPEVVQGNLQTLTVGAMVIVLMSVAGLHLYWAVGGRRGLRAAIPQAAVGGPVFRPGAAITVAVALALGGYAALVGGLFAEPLGAARPYLLAAGIVVFLLRVLGDFRYVGLFKSVLRTEFAARDTAVYVPLCFALAWGSFISLL